MRWLQALWFIGALALAPGLMGVPARAHDLVGTELQPLVDELSELKGVSSEIERRARQRVSQLQKWVDWWTKVKEFFSETATRLARDFDERIVNMQKATATLSGLTDAAPPGKRNLPQHGWHDTLTIAKAAADLEKERAKSLQLAAELKASWFIAGVGWMTGLAIQRAIDDTQKEIRDIQQAVRDGSHVVNVSGYGWTRGSTVSARIAELEKQEKSIRERVASGDYPVTIPGLGVRTRKLLDAEISALEADIARRRAKAAAGELSIHRPAFDWKTKNQLQAELAAADKAFEATKKAVSDGIYSSWLVENGWAKRVELEARVKSLDQTLAKTQDALAKGEYRAQLPVGWSTAKEIERSLESLGKQLGVPHLDAKARERIAKEMEVCRKSLAELQSLSALDLALLALERAKVSRWITGFMALARPDLERRELVRSEASDGLDDYSTEETLWIRPLENQLARLKAAKAWIPGSQ